MGYPGDAAEQLTALVGRRVALRHRRSARDGGPTLTDSVGELADGGPGAVLVHTRRGVVRVLRDAVVAVREIPPPMPRRPSWAAVARLERICADAWPPVVRRPLGQWRLRAADGFTGRANSALVVGDPGMPVADALDVVRSFAADHDIAPKVQVALASPWARAITARGWTRDDTHPAGADVAVLVSELPQLALPEEHPPMDERSNVAAQHAAERFGDRLGLPRSVDPDWLASLRIRVDERPDPDWWWLSADHPARDAQRHVLTAPGLQHVGFALAREPDGQVVGVARLAVVDAHLHVARLVVARAYRRRGLGGALMRAAARWGASRAAARWCVLQVAEHNAPALALYHGLGFRLHHRYQYLAP